MRSACWIRTALMPQAAVDDFKRVVEMDDNDADTWYFLGTVYSQLKQFPQAIDAFDHALKLNPLHASAQFGLSRAYQQSGDSPHAREHLDAIPVHHAEQARLGHEPGVRRAGQVFAGGGVAGSRAESPAADSGEVCGCDEGSGAEYKAGSEHH